MQRKIFYSLKHSFYISVDSQELHFLYGLRKHFGPMKFVLNQGDNLKTTLQTICVSPCTSQFDDMTVRKCEQYCNMVFFVGFLWRWSAIVVTTTHAIMKLQSFSCVRPLLWSKMKHLNNFSMDYFEIWRSSPHWPKVKP